MKWYENTSDMRYGVIMSSRIRLARNTSKYAFPSYMRKEEANALLKETKNIFDQKVIYDKGYYHINMGEVKDLDKLVMMERHLVSPTLLKAKIPNAVISTDDQSISIMVNEEDHFRIQSMSYGMDLQGAYERANQIDDYVEESFDYAYDKELGYLTACPTNVGTGLRASYMIHVPALESSGQLRIILDAIGKFGITFRGIYGESSDSVGSVFQVSNQVTLGFSEQEIIDNLNSVSLQIVDQELAVREKLLLGKRLQFEDSVYRAYGILKHAKILTSQEAMTLLSDIKLGIELGLIRTKDYKDVNIFSLMTSIQPASLQKLEKKKLNVEERDIARAAFIRENLPEVLFS